MGSAFDTVLSVRTRCDAPESEIACNDEGTSEPGPSQVEIEANADQPLFIIVEGFTPDEYGSYALRIQEGACE